jgi:hypothetical protein
MKRTFALISIILALSGLGLYAEEPAVQEPAVQEPAAQEPAAQPLSQVNPNALGFSFGSDISPISVFCLHYQHWWGKIGASVSAGGWLKDAALGLWGADAFLSAQYKVSEGNFLPSGNLYGCLYGFLQSGYVAQMNYGTTSYNIAFSQYIPVEVGIGMELVLLKHISLPLEVGFEYQIMGTYFGPAVTTALRYRF